MRSRLFLLWALVGACGYDTSTIVNVAPSADTKMDDIAEAVERLNALLGEELYVLQSVDSEERIDGEIVIRGVDELEKKRPLETRIGNTKKTRKGVVVRIVPRATPSAIAHELGHAAGLSHVEDPSNLMFRETAPARFLLNEEQLEYLRAQGD